MFSTPTRATKKATQLDLGRLFCLFQKHMQRDYLAKTVAQNIYTKQRKEDCHSRVDFVPVF